MKPHFNILLVDDDPRVISVLGSLLQDFGQLRFATGGADALRLMQAATPDLVLLDVDMPGMGGFELCAAMKEMPLLSDVPVIFVTGHDSAEHELRGLELGAVDFIAKPPRPALVAARVRTHLRMKHMADQLREAALRDGLTGVANRRHFDETLQREWQRAVRNGTPLSMLMIDLDAFKAYNDHYGHPAGDRCLAAVAQALGSAVHRPADLVARYGGEEFAVLLPETDPAGAQHLALQLLQAVEALGLPHAGSPVAGHVTLSIGVSTHDTRPADGANGSDLLRGFDAAPRAVPGDLVDTADRALYAAKQGGRRQARFLPTDGPAALHTGPRLQAVPPAPPAACRAA